ncbi:MFS transporter [Apiospora marii]|uniref:MFS transporter n=1 Tax=Apiospora marii TaxID=335849 RepID=A0ABR1R9Y6_9PEZI
MQSFTQYRRIRAAVEQDLTQCKRSSTTAINVDPPNNDSSTSTPRNPESEGKPPSLDLPQLPGVTATRPAEDDGVVAYIVGWKVDGPLNPQNRTLSRKWAVTFAVCLLTVAITLISSVDAPVAPEFNAHYGVDAVAGSMTAGMYLLGSGADALVAGTASETFGRNVVYMTTFVAFLLFVLAEAHAPDYCGAVVFRFVTDLFGSTPMTAAGGTMAEACHKSKSPLHQE